MVCNVPCEDCLLGKPLRKGFDLVGNYISLATLTSKTKEEDILPLTKAFFNLIHQYESTNDVVIAALSVVLFTLTEEMAIGVLKVNPSCKSAKEFLDAYAPSKP